MRNVSDQTCKENQNTHFMFNYIFSDSGAFMKSCGKIWYSQTGHDDIILWCLHFVC